MNPGVLTNIIVIVLLILAVSGWGRKTIRDGKLTPKLISVFLLLYLLTADLTFRGPSATTVSVGGLYMPILLTIWAMVLYRTWSGRAQWLIGSVTIASALIVLMTLVPLDPAFFILEADALYPISAVFIAVLSVKRPFVAVTIAYTGMMLAGLLDPLIHRSDLSRIILLGGEIRDLASYTAIGVLATHGIYHGCAAYLLQRIRGWRGTHQEEGDPEHA